jgi:nucleoside-diphosphate-sugar epimerase
MKKYVVTGGSGFIGSAIVRRLLERGADHVTVIDNFSSGKEGNLAEVADKVTVHKADCSDYDAVLPIVTGADVVFHIGAIPSVPKSIDEPIPSHDSNINGTFHTLRACADAMKADGKVKRVVYAASSSAYGDTEVLPKVESMSPSPKSPYALQKLVGEYYMSVFHECYGLQTTSLRFFNVFGPRQDPSSPYSGVLSIFMKCLLEKKNPTIFGDGNQTRDFTYVEDVAELVCKAGDAPSANGAVYNAGNGGRITLNEVWDHLQKIEGVSLPANYGPPRAGDVRDSQADTTAVVAALGHAPRFSLEEGLRRTLEWYRHHR